MDEDSDWLNDVTNRLPLGACVRARVTARPGFGLFVEINEAPGITGLIRIVDYRPTSTIPVSPHDLPPVGTELEAVVVDHNGLSRQVGLRVDAS